MKKAIKSSTNGSVERDLLSLKNALSNALDVMDSMSEESTDIALDVLGHEFYDNLADGVQDLSYEITGR